MFQLVILEGNVGRDPDVRTVGDTSKSTFPLATTKTWKGKDGEKHEKVTWHRVVCWRSTADFVGKYVAKGKPVRIVGEIDENKYVDKDGNEKTSYEIVAKEVSFLPSPNPNGGNYNNKPAQTKPKAAPAEDGYASDDIPF